MRFDLFTLYVLAIGTLILSVALTLWEGQARPQRRRELQLFAAGYAMLAAGCVIAIIRQGVLGSALGNLTFVSGYLLVLNGVAAINGRRYAGLSVAMLVALALAWMAGGSRWEADLWSYIGGIPIVVAVGLTAWEMIRCRPLRALRSHPLVVALLAMHTLFYAGRLFVLPLLEVWLGPAVIAGVAKLTMYEGVLYSVGMPMALLAVVREESHAQLLESSRRDFLTGLGNRQWFFEQGERLLRQRAADEPVALLAFDLDHFKSINDRHGHAMGDEILKAFAGIARHTLGPEAALARIGGEEFVALLPGYERTHARDIGRVLAARFAEAVPRDPRSAGVEATVSIGVAAFGGGGTTLGEMLSSADRALYLAKERGRNRIELDMPLALAPAC
ncbi:GGDEF domain-containing protein [Sphingomonas sp. CCH5-D11]|uniref:GGDEF domain-containing protein n=1 Tax=Sphingomonas sp. CCH5-D11 TaxID=1768786 RepID=UPI00082EE253|nr:GGDEF domain-containing protein [Sphingomonas sp. CCH5-D11]